MNPVLARELKERMRGLRAFVALGVFLALLTLTVWIVYKANDLQNVSNGFSFDLERQTRLGRELFEWLISIMLILLFFLVPGLTAGTISGERERQTLTTLQLTLLKPRSIIWGKVQAAVVYLSLMIVAALPLFAVAYQLGGVSLTDAFKGIGAVLIVGLMLATMVASVSAFAKRVQTATLLGYGFSALLAISSFVVFGVASIVDGSRGIDDKNPPAALLTPNPLTFVADFTAGENVRIGSTPLRAIREVVVDAYNTNDGWFGRSKAAERFRRDSTSNNGGILIDNGGNRHGFPAWVISLGTMVGLAGLLFMLACRRLRTPAETER
jgi:ABC-type transport system involved in multi-copper enzyme maturation permease subunit